MALRKTYFNLEPVLNQKINLDVSEFYSGPRRRGLYNEMFDIIMNNSMPSRRVKIPVYKDSFNINVFLISIVQSENKKLNPESTVEICPRWTTMRGNPACLTVMVRYLDNKDLEIFEKILYKHFKVGQVENDG